MKIAKLVLMTFLATALTGCIFVDDDEDDDDGVTVTDGIFHATWVWAGSGSCASTQTDTVSYVISPASNPDDFTEYLFDCVAASGDTDPMALDDYTYVVQALDCSADPDPRCPNGIQRGLPSNDVEDTFLEGCNDVVGTTCIVDMATATLVVQ